MRAHNQRCVGSGAVPRTVTLRFNVFAVPSANRRKGHPAGWPFRVKTTIVSSVPPHGSAAGEKIELNRTSASLATRRKEMSYSVAQSGRQTLGRPPIESTRRRCPAVFSDHRARSASFATENGITAAPWLPSSNRARVGPGGAGPTLACAVDPQFHRTRHYVNAGLPCASAFAVPSQLSPMRQTADGLTESVAHRTSESSTTPAQTPR
jgi:hypothetical protein